TREMTFKFSDFKRDYHVYFGRDADYAEVDTQDQKVRVPTGQTVSSSRGGDSITIAAVNGLQIVDVSTLPPSQPTVLTLDSVYDQIVPGGWVAVERPGKDPLICKAIEVRKISASNYGMSARVTQLTLEKPWLDDNDRLLDVARKTTVSAQSELLSL